MGPRHAYDLELGSERFLDLCTRLNATVRRDDAAWSADLLSGGFKFDDEIPDGLDESPEAFLPLITLLRRLWAYRISLVEGQPRPELAPAWEWTRRLAPQWAGFAPDRCSAIMRSVVDQVKARDARFARDGERLEARLRTSGEGGDNGADAGTIAGVDGYPIDMK
jgi:hypothetical protein